MVYCKNGGGDMERRSSSYISNQYLQVNYLQQSIWDTRTDCTQSRQTGAAFELSSAEFLRGLLSLPENGASGYSGHARQMSPDRPLITSQCCVLFLSFCVSQSEELGSKSGTRFLSRKVNLAVIGRD